MVPVPPGQLPAQTQPGAPTGLPPGGLPAGQPPPVRPGFGMGFKSLFGGLGFVLTTPRVWGLALVPIVIAFVLTGILGWFFADLFSTWVGGWIDPDSTATSVLRGVLQVVAAVVGIIAAVLLSFGIAQTLAGPALEGMVRHQERALGLPERPQTSFMVEIGRSLSSALIPIVFGTPILVAMFFVELFVPPSAIVIIPLKVIVLAAIMGWDVCDYPLSVRGMSITDRVDTLLRYKGAILGFSLGMVGVAMIPCALLLILPAGVAGATRLLHEVERWEQHAPPA